MPLPAFIAANPQTSLMVASLLSKLGANFMAGRDAKKFQKKLEKEQATSNLVNALSRGRFNAPPTAQPRTSTATNILSTLGGVADIVGAVQGARRSDQLFDLQKRSLEQGLEGGTLENALRASTLAQQRGAGKFAQADALQNTERMRLTDQLQRGPQLENLPRPSFLDTARQEQIQQSRPVGPLETLGFGLAQKAADTNATQHKLEERKIGLEERRVKLEEGKFDFLVGQTNQKLQEVVDPGLSPKERFDAEQDLRKEYSLLTKSFVTIRDSYARILKVAENPSPAGDLALIFNFMKMLDPSSVVRESEFATAENAGGVPERVRNLWNKALRGERLGVTREDFLAQAKNLFESQVVQYAPLQSQFKNIARSSNLNVDNVLLDTSLAPDLKKVEVQLNLFKMSGDQGAEGDDTLARARRNAVEALGEGGSGGGGSFLGRFGGLSLDPRRRP